MAHQIDSAWAGYCTNGSGTCQFSHERVILASGSVVRQMANLLLWVVALLVFLPHQEKRNVLSLALVAWTLGLRHALGEQV